MDRSTVQVSDHLQFIEELQTSGALKFYENTENVLRSGRFERAYSRYLFLKAHIRGRPLEAGLAAMVDQRLHFLRSQLSLGEGLFIMRSQPKDKASPTGPTTLPASREGGQGQKAGF